MGIGIEDAQKTLNKGGRVGKFFKRKIKIG